MTIFFNGIEQQNKLEKGDEEEEQEK